MWCKKAKSVKMHSFVTWKTASVSCYVKYKQKKGILHIKN